MKNTLWALILTLVAFTTTAQVVQNGDFGLIPGIDYEVAGITAVSYTHLRAHET